MNLDQVAKHAQVSTATVSRVLNNIGNVRSSTRARVMKAVEELRYHPNLLARNLAGGRSDAIGMIVSNLENPFFLDVFRATEFRARTFGKEVIVANTGYDPDHLVHNIRLMIGRRVGGLALIVSEMNPDLTQELSALNIPVVFYDVGTPAQNISNIKVEYSRGVERTVSYLYSLGHRKMAFVGHHQALRPLGVREKTFSDCVARLPDVRSTIVFDNDTLEGGRRAAREVLSAGFKPSAVVCVNDFMALGVLRELRERRLRVPEDISVTGFDNIRLSEYSSPALTTVHIARDLVGEFVCEALCGERKAVTGREMIIEPDMVLRDSTGPANTASA